MITIELNSEKTKYMITSHHQNVKQNQNVVIGNFYCLKMWKSSDI